MVKIPENRVDDCRIADYWDSLDDLKVKCRLCPFNCLLSDGKMGICRGKQNSAGTLLAINYGWTTSLSMDPIEKKPLYNFHPGTSILSIGPNGCNLKCNFCQNYHVSQSEYPVSYLTPMQAADTALNHGSIGLAYTYSEPLIWYEYVRETSVEVHRLGLKNVLVSNGYINPEPLDELLPLVDAMNIDIKSMDPQFYKKVCKATLAPVLETVKRAAKRTHVEITNLIIPGLNDSEENFTALVDFIADIDPLIPLHFSRYHPAFHQNASGTPIGAMRKAGKIARKRLAHVYLGNVSSFEGSVTLCPDCNGIVIERSGYTVTATNLSESGVCGNCGAKTGVVC